MTDNSEDDTLLEETIEQETKWSKVKKWAKRGVKAAVGLTVAAGVAIPVLYKAEKNTGFAQEYIGKEVTLVAGNDTLGNVCQDSNDYDRFVALVRDGKTIPKKKEIEPTVHHKSSLWDFLTSDINWEDEFPSFKCIDKLPFAPDNEIRITSDDKRPIVLEQRVTREYVPLKKIPKHVKSAFIVKEDRNFYDHHGINLWGKVRAIEQFVRTGKLKTAGSGLTEQVAKMVMTPRDELPYRKGVGGKLQKLKEMAYATAIKQRYGKDKILELYLNLADFGNGKYGIGAASKFYFGKNVEDISIAETLFMSVIPRNPGINPTTKKGFAFQWERYGLVLKNYAHQEIITVSDAHRFGANSAVKICFFHSCIHGWFTSTPTLIGKSRVRNPTEAKPSMPPVY